MSTTELVPDAVRQGTPTAVAVYLALDRAGPLTYDDLADELGADLSTVKRAVYDLRAAGVVRSIPNPDNHGQQIHDTV